MPYNPELHHRRSIRLKGYDYSRSGAYFVTLCSWNRECIFGEIINKRMVWNEVGNTVVRHWRESAQVFTGVCIEDFVLMPNHLHGIVRIMAFVSGKLQNSEDLMNQTPASGPDPGISDGNPGITLGKIIRHFKAKSTHEIRRTTNVYQVWQRNSHEHIIRNKRDMNRILKYFRQNPRNWEEEENHPERIRQ